MSRYRDLNPQAVRITLLPSGARLEEIQVRGGGDAPPRWVSIIEAEPLLNAARRTAFFESMRARALVRLEPPVELENIEAFEALSADKRNILALSQAAYAASLGRPPPNGVARAGRGAPGGRGRGNR